MTYASACARAALGVAALTATALATACSAAGGQASPAAAARTHHAHAAPARHAGPALRPVSASFTSASSGWVLARPPCAAHDCRKVLLRRTTDGGRHWSAATAPPAPFWNFTIAPGRAVSGIVFADTRDGWAFGPGLWATHDGARTWRRVPTSGLAVMSMAAGGGRVVAAFGQCRRAFQCRYSVYAARAGSDRWRPVPGTGVSGIGGGAFSAATVDVSGRTGYLIASRPPRGSAVLLAGPADGSARWHRISLPATGCWSAPLTARGRLLVFGCGNQPAAGQQPKLVFLSRDGGRSWRKLTDPPSGGYMTLADVTRTGTIFISGPRGDVAISRDGGRTWHNSPGLSHADIADGLFATVVTSRQAYVLQDSLYFKQVFFSNDDGRTWHPVTIR